MSKIVWDVIITHAVSKGQPCTDGFGSYWVASCFNPDIEVIWRVHGDESPLPDLRGKNVIVADFSFSRPVLEKLKEETANLIVLDHHKTAEENLKGLPFCRFDMNKSGMLMTWEFFKPWTWVTRNEVPPIVEYVSDRDLWRFEMPDSREVNAWLSTIPFDIKLWTQANKAMSNYVQLSHCIEMGTCILAAEQRTIERILEMHTVVETDVGKIGLVNSPSFQSEIGNALAKKYGRGCVWWIDRGILNLSLRGEGANHVDEIARKLGGGGHALSSGARKESNDMEIKIQNLLRSAMEG